jgi:hypothetical protein
VWILTFLVFAEAFLVPLGATLNNGRWPTFVELAAYFVTGLIQAVTVLLALLKKETGETEKYQVLPNVPIVPFAELVLYYPKRFWSWLNSIRLDNR